MELLVVLAVTLLLTGLLLPALSQLRENAHRVICSSNLRQTGMATVMFADDHSGQLPHAEFGEKGRSKREMMASHRGGASENWEGLGHLYEQHYCDAAEVFYCPSHTGEHPFELYQDTYFLYRGLHQDGPRIYTNYHYAGDVDWETGKRRRLEDGHSFAIASDGLRSPRDLNHNPGMNVLRGDSSVTWREDASTRRVTKLLNGTFHEYDEQYGEIWKLLIQD
jgi:hypothetical protein